MIEIRKLPMIQYQNEIFLSQSRENITSWIWEAVRALSRDILKSSLSPFVKLLAVLSALFKQSQ